MCYQIFTPKHRPIESTEALLERLSYVTGVTIKAEHPTVIDEHIVDAAICAISGLAAAVPRLVRNADDLRKFGYEYARPVPVGFEFPEGYRILAAMPEKVSKLIFM